MMQTGSSSGIQLALRRGPGSSVMPAHGDSNVLVYAQLATSVGTHVLLDQPLWEPVYKGEKWHVYLDSWSGVVASFSVTAVVWYELQRD
jgi:hypothetical protein